jgi:Flp pilus assembly protein TadB
MLPLLIAIIAGFSTYMLFVGVWRKSQTEGEASAIQQRLREFQAQSSLGQEVMDARIAQREERGLLAQVGEQVSSLALSGSGGRGILDKIEEKLILSGRPHGWYAQDYVAFVFLTMGSVMIFGALMVQAWLPGFWYLLLVALTGAYCWYELNGRIASRQEQARFELPYFMDEMIMNLSSGSSSLDLVLREVVSGDSAQAGGTSDERVIVTEFRRAYQETSSQTRNFEDAYRAAAARIQVQPISDLVEVLIQGQSGGAPILSILRDMSDNVYSQYEQDISTLIKKKDTTFTIATVIIMLGAAVVIGAPIFDTVLRSLGGN